MSKYNLKLRKSYDEICDENYDEKATMTAYIIKTSHTLFI